MISAHWLRATALTSAVVCGWLMAAPAASANAPYSAVYAFGDSLTDTGNLFGATSVAYGPSNALPQSTDYWQGRFSNGPVAVEVLASALQVPLFNFAFGGATSGTGPVYNYLDGLGQPASLATGLQAQVAGFQALTGGHASASGLYFVWAGANDLRDALVTFNPAVVDAAVQTVYANLGLAVTHLYQSGARDFLLPLLPDLGLTPEGQALQALVPPQVFSLSAFSEMFNMGLRGAYASLGLAGASLTTFDTLAAQRAVYADPAAFGIGDVNVPCFAGYVGEAGAQCAAGFDTTAMFWDKVHPSAATHAILGQQMAAAVPEPATLLTMGLGVLALLGVSGRRRASQG